MKIAPIADVKEKFSAFIRTCHEEPVVVTKNGEPVAVLLSVNNENDLESMLLTHSPKFQSILNSSKKQIQDGKSIKHEAFWEEVDN